MKARLNEVEQIIALLIKEGKDPIQARERVIRYIDYINTYYPTATLQVKADSMFRYEYI